MKIYLNLNWNEYKIHSGKASIGNSLFMKLKVTIVIWIFLGWIFWCCLGWLKYSCLLKIQSLYCQSNCVARFKLTKLWEKLLSFARANVPMSTLTCPSIDRSRNMGSPPNLWRVKVLKVKCYIEAYINSYMINVTFCQTLSQSRRVSLTFNSSNHHIILCNYLPHILCNYPGKVVKRLKIGKTCFVTNIFEMF